MTYIFRGFQKACNILTPTFIKVFSPISFFMYSHTYKYLPRFRHISVQAVGSCPIYKTLVYFSLHRNRQIVNITCTEKHFNWTMYHAPKMTCGKIDVLRDKKNAGNLFFWWMSGENIRDSFFVGIDFPVPQLGASGCRSFLRGSKIPPPKQQQQQQRRLKQQHHQKQRHQQQQQEQLQRRQTKRRRKQKQEGIGRLVRKSLTKKLCTSHHQSIC